MQNETGETMVIIVFPSGEIVTCALEQQSATSETSLLAADHFPPVDAPLTLLRVACALLPESVTKFQAFKAYHTAKREWGALNDRMKATAEPSNDELPF